MWGLSVAQGDEEGAALPSALPSVGLPVPRVGKKAGKPWVSAAEKPLQKCSSAIRDACATKQALFFISIQQELN